jgi:hypothetical protein
VQQTRKKVVYKCSQQKEKQATDQKLQDRFPESRGGGLSINSPLKNSQERRSGATTTTKTQKVKAQTQSECKGCSFMQTWTPQQQTLKKPTTSQRRYLGTQVKKQAAVSGCVVALCKAL